MEAAIEEGQYQQISRSDALKFVEPFLLEQ